VAVTLIGAAILGAPSRAQATFTVTITDGTNTIVSNTKGSYSGTVGVFDIQGGFTTSNAPGTPNLARFSDSNTAVSSSGFSGTKTLTITVEDDFTAPIGGNGLKSILSVGQLEPGGGTATVTYQSFLDAFAGTTLSTNAVAAGLTVEDHVVTSGPFHLKSVTTYTITGTGVGHEIDIQSTGITSVAPAPAGLVLVMSALPVMGLGWVRRRMKGESAVVA